MATQIATLARPRAPYPELRLCTDCRSEIPRPLAELGAVRCRDCETSVELLLTAPQLAHALGLHAKTVYDLAARKKIPSYKIGAALRFRRSEVEEWLVSQRT
jgi:excisionase family DNA binding protein